MKILKERSKQTWETMFPRNERLKLFINKNCAFLLDIYYQTSAYDLGIKFQTRSDYPKKVLGAVSVISNVSKNTDVYNRDDIQKAQDKVDGLYTGSLSPERAKRIKELNLTGEFMRMVPSWIDLVKPTKPISLNEDFKNWLPRYDKKRKSLAKQLKSTFKLKKGFVKNLQQTAFDEILALANTRKKLTNDHRELIILLEHGIDVVFPIFLKDLGMETTLNLKTFRENCKGEFNTICRFCRKPLLRSNLKNYCLIREDRSCYLALNEPTSIRTSPNINTNASTECDNCGIRLFSPQRYKVKGISRFFCSNKCRHTFRQKILRKNKKYSNLDFSSY